MGCPDRLCLAFAVALVAGCGARTAADSNTVTTTNTSSGTDSGSVDCGDLDAAACDAEATCRNLLAGSTLGEGDDACAAEVVDFACIPSEGCGGEACFACSGDERLWVEDCGCLPEGWNMCGAAPADAACECVDNGDCHSAELCENGRCRLCDQWDGCGGCEFSGCPDGYCCTWEDYCLGGTPGPDGFCEDGDPDPQGCVGDDCGLIDVVVVIDNSGTMGEEHRALGPAFDRLVDGLYMLTDNEGQPLQLDVNMLVTSTDMGHPLCTADQPPGYEPLQGAPQEVACASRLTEFETGEASFADACTDLCPNIIEPAWPHIHFEGRPEGGFVTNIPGNNVAGALRCLGPQGVVGCEYSAPLETMLQAINPGASWNQGQNPFLRDDAILAIVVLTDAYDCSVRQPEGYEYFTNTDTYWQLDPDTGTKTGATPAVCWNAGVTCDGPDQDGVYQSCNSMDTGALHPVERYATYLRDELIANQDKDIVMLGVVGVPPVTTYNDNYPFQPLAGGVFDLVYRDWNDAPYPAGDILPGDPDGAQQTFETGIGPGCTGADGMGGFTGQATPPVRLRELCESLDENVGQPNEARRCSLDSVCATDLTSAFAQLPYLVQAVLDPPL